jgi:hypothetical protein
MRKSREVPITLLAALALSSVACNDAPVTRNCVDAQGRIIPDTNCQAHPIGGAHFVYGGSSGGRVGDTVVGGSDSEAGVSRGGFGSGEGEGSGHGGGGEGGGE